MTESSRSLASSARQAVLWSAGLTLFRDGLQFVQMLVMARLLDPGVYGLAGYATTLIGFLGLISFQHVAAHIVQVRPDAEVDYAQHFTFGLLLNGVAFVLANLVALALPLFPAYAKVQPILHVLSLTFLLNVPAELRQRMLQRQHLWHRLRPIEMAAMVVSVVLGISMALAGFGVYALIVPSMAAAVAFSVDLFVFAGFRPRLEWDRKRYADALNFGIQRMGSTSLNSGRKLFESTLIAQHFQFASLGLFGRAEGLSIMLCARVAHQVTEAIYPVITHVAPHSARFRHIAGLVLRSVVWAIAPVAVFLGLEANAIVHTAYGSKWVEVVPLLPVASLEITVLAIGACVYRLLLANEERALCLRSDVAAFVICVTAMWFGVSRGVYVYLWVALGMYTVIGTILLTLLIRTGGVDGRGVRLALLPPVIAGGCAWGVATAARDMLPRTDVLWLDAVIVGVFFGGAYVATLRFAFAAPLAELLGYLPGGPTAARVLRLSTSRAV